MSTQPRMWRVIVGIGLIVMTMACTLPSLVGTATPTPGLVAIGSKEGTGGGTGGGSGSGSGGNQSLPPSNETLPEATATPTIPLPNPGGPYVVKQVESLGGEVISGQVCSLSAPFSVNSATSKVAWVFNFIPKDAHHGILTYVYSIPSAGESHNATGSYTISPPDKDGTLHLSLQVSDHVTFKGFDGNIPVSYKFDLVPSGSTSCPPTP